MSLHLEAGVIHLRGDCPVEAAEALLGLLQAHPAAPVDLGAASALHTAVLQVLLAWRPVVAVPPEDPFARRWLLPLLA